MNAPTQKRVGGTTHPTQQAEGTTRPALTKPSSHEWPLV